MKLRSLGGNGNQPGLRDPKPPFGLKRERWGRIKLRLFGVAALLAGAISFWLITQRDDAATSHTIDGHRLASYYEVAGEWFGCDELSPADEVQYRGRFVGIHQGFRTGPALVDCLIPQECETVSMRDPNLAPPAIFLGPVEEVDWHQWLPVPAILQAPETGSGFQQMESRTWTRDGRCHRIERKEEFTLVEGQLKQTVQILHGSRQCTTYEDPEVTCVLRRVREFRAAGR